MADKQEVWLLIDDYTPDAGSTIYGVYETHELAQDYLDNGIKEDYGENMDTDNIDIRPETVITK